jgi:hypothetical protein
VRSSHFIVKFTVGFTLHTIPKTRHFLSLVPLSHFPLLPHSFLSLPLTLSLYHRYYHLPTLSLKAGAYPLMKSNTTHFKIDRQGQSMELFYLDNFHPWVRAWVDSSDVCDIRDQQELEVREMRESGGGKDGVEGCAYGTARQPPQFTTRLTRHTTHHTCADLSVTAPKR